MRIISDWLATATPNAPVAAGMVSTAAAINGGVKWFDAKRVPVFAAPAAEPVLHAAMGGRTTATIITGPRWIRVGTDSLWVEPVTAPDVSQILAVYSPTLRWLYWPLAGSPAHAADQAAITARLAARGLPVERVGSIRGVMGR